MHGDDRGSADAKHNIPGSPYLPPDPARLTLETHRMTHTSFELSSEAREIVDSTIRRHCEIRNWRLDALNVRSNHVHVVVNCGAGVTPETAMEQFKAWSTRKLREAGFRGPSEPVWTEHGSTRWINTEASLHAAIEYVLHRQ